MSERPVTDDAAYDAAMNALHDATSEAHAWDIAWAPESIQPQLHSALRILGAAILSRDAQIARLREALGRAEGLLHNANDALESDELDKRRETFEHIQDYFDPAEMGGCGDVLAEPLAPAQDALKREVAERVREACKTIARDSESSDHDGIGGMRMAIVDDIDALDLTALLAEARHGR